MEIRKHLQVWPLVEPPGCNYKSEYLREWSNTGDCVFAFESRERRPHPRRAGEDGSFTQLILVDHSKQSGVWTVDINCQQPQEFWQYLFACLYVCLFIDTIWYLIARFEDQGITDHWHIDSVPFSRMDFVCTSLFVGYHHSKKDFGRTTSIRLDWSPMQKLEAR